MRSFIPYLPRALRRLRLEAGLTQREAARRAGITPSMLWGYENGKQLPSVPSLDAALRAVGADLRRLHVELIRVRLNRRKEHRRLTSC